MLRGFIRPMRLFPKARRRFRVLLHPGIAGLEPLPSCPRGEAAAAGRAGDPLLGQADLWAVGRSSGISSFCSRRGLRGRFRTAPPRLPCGCTSAAVPLSSVPPALPSAAAVPSVAGRSSAPRVSADRSVFEQASQVTARLQWYRRGPHLESLRESLNKWVTVGKKCPQALLPSSFQAALPSASPAPSAEARWTQEVLRVLAWGSATVSAAEAAPAAEPPSPRSCLQDASPSVPRAP